MSHGASFSLTDPLVVGFGITGQAVARALLARGHQVKITDDRPSPSAIAAAAEYGVDLVIAPDRDQLAELVQQASILLPSPGVPDHHPVFAAAKMTGLQTASEFDLAQVWDSRPLIAITGTNGKTTVTTMVTDALERSGIAAAAVGNTDLPLVQAIDDPSIDVFVVEASSFRLAHSLCFRPAVATWLNFSPDHLDAHASLESYRLAKASVWSGLGSTGIAVVNLADPVVSDASPTDNRGTTGSATDSATAVDRPQVQTFGTSDADWRVSNGALLGPMGAVVEVAQMPRQQPHDLDNAAAAAATAFAAGATIEAIAEMLGSFSGLPHRLALVGETGGVRWFNDSKATVPEATVVAVSGFDSVILLAGGRNKGVDLSTLRSCVPPVKMVIAMGDSAPELVDVFRGVVTVETASDMADAVDRAAQAARSGDVVILSPACTSFDWYKNYEERGDDFVRRATERLVV